MKTIQLLAIFACLIGLPANSRGQDIRVSLLTCGTGDEMYSLFGHNAIRVQDPAQGIDQVYNFGVFDFDTPNFTWKFMRGKLMYKLDIQPWANFYHEYNYDKRWVIENEALLDAADKAALLDLLDVNYLPQNRYYPYDFFFDNCATRIRDLFERALGGRMTYVFPKEAQASTYRLELDPYIGHRPWLDFGIDLLLGYPADQIADNRGQMYLPDGLMQNLSYARVDGGKPLLGPPIPVLDLPKPNHPAPLPLPFIVFGLLLLAMLPKWRGRKTAEAVLWVLFGLAGALIAFMWFGTDHQTTRLNANLIWLHPVQLAAGIALLRGSQARWLKIFGRIQLALIALLPFVPQDLPWHAIPLIILATVLAWRLAKVNDFFRTFPFHSTPTLTDEKHTVSN